MRPERAPKPSRSYRKRSANDAHGHRTGYDHTDRSPFTSPDEDRNRESDHKLTASKEIDVDIEWFISWLVEASVVAYVVRGWRERGEANDEECGLSKPALVDVC